MVKNWILTANYGMKLYFMVTSLLQSLHIHASVPDQHCWTTAAIVESFTSDKTVKNSIFTAFHDILRHFLVKISTEFFIFCFVTFVYIYITALHGWQCWGIFKKLPQLRRGVIGHAQVENLEKKQKSLEMIQK